MVFASPCRWLAALAALVGVLFLNLLALPVGAHTRPCFAPQLLADDWEPGSAAEAHVNAAAIHAVLIARHGGLIAELYRRGNDRSIYSLFGREVSFGPADRHDMRSIGKSVVGLLVGIALIAATASPIKPPRRSVSGVS
jgi:hypothetical protein